MYYYIINPAAGGGVIDSIQDRLKATLSELHIDGEFAKTIGEGDAKSMAAKAIADGAKTVVAVGGGETAAEVIDAAYRSRKAVAVGFIPIGKENLLAAALGVGNWKQACEVLATRRLIDYQLPIINEKIVVSSISFSLPPPEKAEEEQPSRLTSFLKPGRVASNFEYKLEIDRRLKARGAASLITISNQKLVSPSLDNQLIAKVNLQEPAAGWAAWFGGKGTTHYSQFHGQRFNLRTPQPILAESGGAKLISKYFETSLTERPLKLIANFDRFEHSSAN